MPDCSACPHNDPAKQKAAGITPRLSCCVDGMEGHRRLMDRMASGQIGAPQKGKK